MADAQIRAVITADDRASKTIANVGGSFKDLAAGVAVGQLAVAAFSKAMQVVTDNIGSAVKRVDTLNNSNRVFANMGFAGDAVKTSMENLKQSILGLPTPLDSAVRGMQMIASTTTDIGRAQSIFTALNDGIIGFGGSASMVENAVLQLSQAFSNGRIDAQTWNSMMQSGLGATLNAIAKQMGITTGALKEGLSDGTYSVEQFQTSLINLDKNGGGGLKSLQTIAKDATSGIGTGIENAQTAMSRGIANIITAIGSENISGAFSTMGAVAEKAFTSIATWINAFQGWLQNLNPVIEWFNQNMWATWAVMGALGAVFLSVVIPALIAGTVAVWGFAAGVIAATWPVLAIGAAVGAIAYLIVNHWETIKNAFVGAFGFIMEKAEYMKNHFFEIVGFIIGFFATLPIKIPMLIANAIVRSIAWLSQVNWSAVFSNIGHAFGGTMNWLWDQITGIFNRMKGINWGEVFMNAGRGIGNSIVGLLEGAINGALSGIPGTPRVSIPRFASGVSNFGGGLAVVGERGAELVNLPGGSDVIPNHQIGGSVTVNVSLSGIFTGTAGEARKLAEMVASNLKTIASSRNIPVSELLGG